MSARGPIPVPILSRLAGLLALGTAAIGGSAAAQAASCTLASPGLAFGTYSGIAQVRVDTSSSFTLTCTGPGVVNYTVTLSAGQSGSLLARQMASGVNRLSYQVYLDSARTQVFGSGAGGTMAYSSSLTSTVNPVSANVPVYGSVLSGQNAKVGSYTDTLTLLVTY